VEENPNKEEYEILFMNHWMPKIDQSSFPVHYMLFEQMARLLGIEVKLFSQLFLDY